MANTKVPSEIAHLPLTDDLPSFEKYIVIYDKINPSQSNGIFHKATYNKVRMVHSIY